LQLPPEVLAKNVRYASGTPVNVDVLPSAIKAITDLNNEGAARGFFKEWLRIEDQVDWQMPESSQVVRDDFSAIIEEAKSQGGSRTFWTTQGQKLAECPISQLLQELGINVSELQVKKIEYKDPFFLSPSAWKTMLLLLREFSFAENATVNIVASDKRERENDHIFQMPYSGVAGIRCGKFCNFNLREENAKNVADFVCENVGNCNLSDIKIEYSSDDINHGRVMELHCIENGQETKYRLIFDRGLDFLAFQDLNVPLFGSNVDGWVKYSGEFYIVHEEL
jgi:hypothetical protein